MIKGYVRPSVPKDPEKVAPILRDLDKAEIDATAGLDHAVALSYAMQSCILPLTIVDDNEEPFAMFGVNNHPSIEEYGQIWLLSSDYLFKAKMPFLRQSKLWQEAIEQPYSVVGNLVSEVNIKHIRWRKWLGYRFIARHPEFGFTKQPFLEFVRITECAHSSCLL